MLEIIKRKLSIKVSIFLAVITIPPMIAAAYLISSTQGAQLEKLTLESGTVAAMTGAKMYGMSLDAGIDAGFFTIGDLMNPTYEEIKGFDWGDNERFHTRYDAYCDRMIKMVQDKILDASSDFSYAVGNDLTGYIPSHNARFEQSPTGDSVKDLVRYRAKRKLALPMHLAAARNLEPVLIQAYLRDTGEQIWDVSSPIFVKGQHWGSFRIGVARDSLALHKHTLMLQLATAFLFLSTVTIGCIFLMLRRSMRPLEHLAMLASEISTGENLDKPITASSSDEIGQMGKSLNRLRGSLQSAMGRLGE